MEAMVLLPQTMILLAMMLCGSLAYKKHWLTDEGWKSLNTLTVKILYPFLMLSITASYDYASGDALIKQDFICMVLFFVLMIAVGTVYTRCRRLEGKKKNIHQLMVVFSNIGFIGVPLVRALYGDSFAFYLLFYIMGFNLLCFTYGVYLASGGQKVDVKNFFNAGTIGTIAAILLYVFRIRVPGPVQTFFDYMSGMIIPTSMILIGGSLAMQDLRSVAADKENYIISAMRLLAAPLIGILVIRFLPFDPRIKGTFVLVCATPIASTAGTLAEVYSGMGKECNGTIALSTILSVVTIPLIFAVYSLVG